MRWLFDIAAFVTRSASAWNVDTVPEESESENSLEFLQLENCVTFRPKIKGVLRSCKVFFFVGCYAVGSHYWMSKNYVSHEAVSKACRWSFKVLISAVHCSPFWTSRIGCRLRKETLV